MDDLLAAQVGVLPPPATCRFCGADDELRLGSCFDCATMGEERAARRSVLNHLCHGAINLIRRRNGWGRWDLAWAWERLTKTGDYAPNGYFAHFGISTGSRVTAGRFDG